MKKKCLALVAILFSLQITGCGAINLTVQEKNVIAEYIANILLKHDKAYETTFQYDLEEEEEIEEPPKEEEEEPSKDNEEKKEENKTQQGTNIPKEDNLPKYVEIETIYQKGLKVSPVGYSFYKIYPKKVNAILPIEASSGNTICVVNLKLKNTSFSSKKLDFFTKDYIYKLEVSGKNTYTAIQSIFIDDIQNLDVTLKAGKSYEAMVAFEIPEKAKNKSFKLLVTKGSKTADLKLK